jgi:hypothetical protein
MNSTDPTAASPGTYTPGYRLPKALMILFGVFLVALGLWELRSTLWLLAFGQSVRAEATYVIKSKEGLPDRILRDDSQVQANVEAADRSYVFWNEFSFQTAQGGTVHVRAPVGSQLKPLYPLLDDDGLPTTDLVYYDRSNPNLVAFPLIVSTWYASGVLIVVGLLCAFVGSFLYYWADKPIILPHIPPASKSTTDSPDRSGPAGHG